MLVIILTQSNNGPSGIIRGISGPDGIGTVPREALFKTGEVAGSLPSSSNAYRSTRPRVYQLLYSGNKQQNKVVKESLDHNYVWYIWPIDALWFSFERLSWCRIKTIIACLKDNSQHCDRLALVRWLSRAWSKGKGSKLIIMDHYKCVVVFKRSK